MSCPTELELAMLADGELDAAAAGPVAEHAAGCARCTAELAALRLEIECLAAALAVEPSWVEVPAFERPASWGAFVAWATSVLGVTAFVSAAPALFDLRLPPGLAWLETGLSWLNPFSAGGLADLAVRAVLFIARSGGAIMTSLTETAAAAVVLAFVLWIAATLRRRGQAPLVLASLACAIAVLPSISSALEIRRVEDGPVHVPADETIDDTLIALGDTVEIDGDVEGDLIAFGRLVTIRGRVAGQVITGAQIVNLNGDVGGSVVGFAQTLNVSPAGIGRNLFGFGSTVNASDSTRIGQNAVVFAQRANFAGPVDRDVLGFADEIEVGDAVGGDLTAWANRITLLAPARIAGDFTAHVHDETQITVSPSAMIGGERITDVRTPRERESEFSRGGFYVSQILRYAAAFVVGLIVLALVPSLRRVTITSPGNALVAAGIGLVTLVAVPIIALLTAFTVIGIPVAGLALLAYIAAIYLAKIMLAHLVGRKLFSASGTPRHFAVALAAGLAIVIVTVNLPWIGGLLNFLLTIAGLGLIVVYLWGRVQGEPPATAEA